MAAAGMPKSGGRVAGTPNRPKAAPSNVAAKSDIRVGTAEIVDIHTKFPAYKLVRTDELVPYANNARTHSPAQIEKIVSSVREFGFTNPVLTDGKRGIIAGHGRVLAAQVLGLDMLPTIELRHLSAAQRRAYVIADNKLALDAGWDESLLALEFGELRDLGFDLPLTGFDLPEIGRLLGLDQWAALPDGDKAPFQQITFTVHDQQAEQIGAALAAAKAAGPFADGPNENSNGNALARICETFLTHASS